MRKLLSILPAFCLAFGCIFALVACGENEPSNTSVSSETSKEYAGYSWYKNGDIAFVYPSDWTETNNGTVLLQGTKNTNNITVVYEAATNAYDNWTAETFATDLQPALESVGMSVSDVSVKHTEEGGFSMTEVSYRAVFGGTAMEQTIFIVTVADRTYSVTVTEVVADDTLVQNVKESLKLLQ